MTLLLLLAACTGRADESTTEKPIDSAVDTSTGVSVDTSSDTSGADTATESGEDSSGVDTGPPDSADDSGSDSSDSATTDTGMDTALDTATDTATDTGRDTGPWRPGMLSPPADGYWTGGVRLGIDVAALGDVDGDGGPDVGFASAGPVYVMTTPPSGRVDVSTAYALVGPDYPGETTGPRAILPVYTVAALGDADGDSLADLVQSEHGVHNSGRFFTYTGLSGRVEDPLGTYTGGSHEGLGWTLLSMDGAAGRLVVAGAPGGGGRLNGSVYIYAADSAGELPQTSAVAALEGERSSMLGRSLAAADLDGDGTDDLLVGTAGDTVWMIPDPEDAGLPVFNVTVDTVGHRLTYPSTYEFGARIAASTDLDGDGRTDFLVADPWADSRAGAVYAYVGLDGTSDVDATSPWATFTFPALPCYAGLSIASADLGHDGAGDVLIADVGRASDGCIGAHAYAYDSPGPGTHDETEAALVFEDPRAPAAGSVSLLITLPGDMDGNGFDDVILTDVGGDPMAGEGFYYGGPLW